MIATDYINLDGILLLDKPTGITSNKILQQVKYLFNSKKAGHTGSLDPLATGVLPICFGEATKFAGYLLAEDKSYQVVAKLGVTTDTGDADGKIITTMAIPALNAEQVKTILQPFCGEIQQLPPMYSALKYKGQPLYKMARKGIELERKPRVVTIYKIELISFQKEYLTLQVTCSKGTYIRSLVEDVGNVIGCGAHVVALRRLQVGHYKITDAITMEELQRQLRSDRSNSKALLLPIDNALVNWPQVLVSDHNVNCLMQGQQVAATGSASCSGSIKLIAASSGKFLGIGEVITGGVIVPKRLINITKST